MKKMIFLFMTCILFSCGSQDEGADVSDSKDAPKEEIKPESSEKLKKVQDMNVELEEVDGELDSIINSIK